VPVPGYRTLPPGGKGKARAAQTLIEALGRLHPTIRDLDSVDAWAAPPPGELLAQIRHNSSATEWLAASAAPHANPDAADS
jgi:hypothetical protein